LASLTVIPHIQQRLLLVHSNDPEETILYRGWTDAFWLNEEAPNPQDGFTLSRTMSFGQIIADLLTTDFAYVDFNNRIHRVTGLLSMANLDLIRIPIVKDIRFYAYGIILEWDPMEFPVGVEASSDLENWICISEPSQAAYRTFLYEQIEGLGFFRLVGY
jgi:hypothetical protein